MNWYEGRVFLPYFILFPRIILIFLFTYDFQISSEVNFEIGSKILSLLTDSLPEFLRLSSSFTCSEKFLCILQMYSKYDVNLVINSLFLTLSSIISESSNFPSPVLQFLSTYLHVDGFCLNLETFSPSSLQDEGIIGTSSWVSSAAPLVPSISSSAQLKESPSIILNPTSLHSFPGSSISSLASPITSPSISINALPSSEVTLPFCLNYVESDSKSSGKKAKESYAHPFPMIQGFQILEEPASASLLPPPPPLSASTLPATAVPTSSTVNLLKYVQSQLQQSQSSASQSSALYLSEVEGCAIISGKLTKGFGFFLNMFALNF
jgi:hypothetical protein